MKPWTLALFVLLLGTSLASACTFTWDAVTTTTDGAVVAGVKYKLFFTAVGTTIEQVVADVDQPTVTLLCAAGTYAVSAYAPNVLESAKSVAVVLLQATKPVNLRWTH